MADIILTLLSSNQVVQYEQNIFSVLSLPRDSIFQFSYQEKYLDKSVIKLFNTNKILNNRAVVVFRSKAPKKSKKLKVEESFCIPIRWVQIQSVERISNGGWVITFVIKGYPKYTSQFASDSESFRGINQSAGKFFSNLKKHYLSVLGRAIDLVEVDENTCTPESDSENWYEIVKSIARIPAYKDYHFLKCSKFYMQKMDGKTYMPIKTWCEIKDNHIVVIEREPLYIDIEYFAATYTRDVKRKIDVLFNDKVLNRTSGLLATLQSRYGTMKIGFQSQKVANNTITELVITTKNAQNDELLTELKFPIIVKKDKKYRLGKAIVMGLGALLVALPGITRDNIQLIWNIILAGLGVLVLGVGSYWESKD